MTKLISSGPDPGNSPPERWSEPLSEEELAEFRERRAQHRLERETRAEVVIVPNPPKDGE